MSHTFLCVMCNENINKMKNYRLISIVILFFLFTLSVCAQYDFQLLINDNYKIEYIQYDGQSIDFAQIVEGKENCHLIEGIIENALNEIKNSTFQIPEECKPIIHSMLDEIYNNRIRQALDIFISIDVNCMPSTLILAASNLATNENSYSLGIIPHDDYCTTFNRALLFLLAELDEILYKNNCHKSCK